jgi:hypothetical protein
MASSNQVALAPQIYEEFKTPRGTGRRVKGSKAGTARGGAGPGNVSPRASTQTGIAAIMDDLDKFQGQQITFGKKIEKERERKDNLEIQIREATNAVNYYRNATKNGAVVKEDEMMKKKLINKLEYQIGEARNKLSAYRKKNQALKTEIIEGRQDKLLHLTIAKELKHELKESEEMLEEYKEDINIINNKKQRKEVEISNQKQKIFDEMDDFSNEMSRAKKNVAKTQVNILDGIREKLQLTFSPLIDNSPKKVFHEPEPEIDEEALARAQKLQDLLTEVGSESLEDIIISLKKAEEEMYQKYHDIQEMTEEMEKLDVSNKHLESDLDQEQGKLEALEANSKRQSRELEGNINEIQEQIQKCKVSYDKNLFVLQSVQTELMHILTYISVDGDATDKSFQVTGVNDRNIPEFLGRVEERIDTLIQMNKAANHIGIQREDFIRLASGQKASKVNETNYQPNLPSLMDEYDDNADPTTATAITAAAETEKVLPINVGELKDFMRKKVAAAEALKRADESPSPNKQEKDRKVSVRQAGSGSGSRGASRGSGGMPGSAGSGLGLPTGFSKPGTPASKPPSAPAPVLEEDDAMAEGSVTEAPKNAAAPAPAPAAEEPAAPMVPSAPSTARPGTSSRPGTSGGGRPGTSGTSSRPGTAGKPSGVATEAPQ